MRNTTVVSTHIKLTRKLRVIYINRLRRASNGRGERVATGEPLAESTQTHRSGPQRNPRQNYSVQELLRYKDVSAMMIYTQVMNKGRRKGLRRPFDLLSSS